MKTNYIGKTATTVNQNNDEIIVKYHNTNVVTVTKDKIVLNTGGWFTPTTKRRMNETADEFNLGFRVYQKARQFFASYKGKDIEFNGRSLELAR